ncbi:MAG: SpoIIE family protein phosphatase, partial [Bacteroidota bacterium]
HGLDPIQAMLRQKETNNNSGMDLAVICLEKAEGRKVKLCYSGAKNSIYVKQPGGLIKTLKADRRSVGGNQNENIAFTNQSLILDEGDYIYLASDGFEDQNNAKRKRFGSNKLQIILDNLYGLPSDIQKERLEHILDEYMMDTDQRDDILLLGVQV